MLYIFSSERPCFPFFYDSGAERTVYAVIEGLIERDIEVVQLSVLPEGGLDEEVMGLCCGLGLTCQEYAAGNRRSPFTICPQHPWVLLQKERLSIIGLAPEDFYAAAGRLLAALQPDLLVTYLKGSERLIQMAHAAGIPSVHRVFGVGAFNFPALSPSTRVLANSPVAAQACRERYGYLPEYIYSLVDFDLYRVQGGNPEYVTFINPREKKGLFLFCDIVRLLPDIPFLAIQGWGGGYSEEEEQALAFLRSAPNVRLMPAVQDIRPVYAKTKILIAPSKWVETFGRVIVEAQFNGIPVVASDRGNLPATTGNGGVILPYGHPELWADAIRKLYADEALLLDMQARARENSKRFDPALLMGQYFDFFLRSAQQNPVVSSSSEMEDKFRSQIKAERSRASTRRDAG
ncbi:MAG: glycosyltransferase [Phaeodactylibacter sp.]|nr:glycosyltransferase [Phaeodactylibacter sp.]